MLKDNNEVIVKGNTAPKNAAKDGKLRASLIPMDILIELLVPAYEEGLIKYERESWRRGFVISEMIDAVDRHMTKFSHEGEEYDQEAAELGIKKHHLAGAIFSLISAYHTLKYHPHLDDRCDPATGYRLNATTEEEKKAA